MPRKPRGIGVGRKVFVLPKPSRKTKKRIEGVKSLSRMAVDRNPVAHAVMTTKDASEALHKIRYGKDFKYRRLIKRIMR